MKTLKTTYVHKYPVKFLIDKDERLDWLKDLAKESKKRFLVVVDREVERCWGKQLRNCFQVNQSGVEWYTISASEKAKSLTEYPKLIDWMEKNRANLGDWIIGIGGGTILDLVSFTASTYMRGLPLIMIPTTLIGIVDASTAGKTCLNTSRAKNILGTYYYPEVVYNNIHFLNTNKEYYHRQGLSEVFKYGLLNSSDLLDSQREYLDNRNEANLLKMIDLGIKARINIRKRHPQASNFGHTFGHALERLSGYKLLHGDAITTGAVMALDFGFRLGVTSKKVKANIIQEMKVRGLNIWIDKGITAQSLVDEMMRDKKVLGKTLNLVLLRDIEKPYQTTESYFYQTSRERVVKFLESFLRNYPYKVDNVAGYIKKDRLVYD